LSSTNDSKSTRYAFVISDTSPQATDPRNLKIAKQARLLAELTKENKQIKEQQFPVVILGREFVEILIFCFVNGAVMMLAFLVDQSQQLCCKVFQAALEKLVSKRHLWEKTRANFIAFLFNSMTQLLTALVLGIAPQRST